MTVQPNPKHLIVCFDGTWNNADNIGGDTNVARLSRSIHANVGTGGVPQLVLYLRGVGTTGLDASKILAGATGLGIDDNIRSAYMFLAQNYVPGDRIYMFGFSRGAFTARSVVGLMNAAGLLKRQSLGHLGDAWKYYRSREKRSPQGFLKKHPDASTHTSIEVAFLGVWDTVGALGLPSHFFDHINHELYGFYDTSVCPIVRKACHALAIDEHRDTFVPTLWTGDMPAGTSVEQVWFAGAHADVGGGYEDRRLADIPLVWMARKAQAAGLKLDWTCLPDPGKLDPHAPAHNSSTGVFTINRAVPTLREVCGFAVDVPLYQRFYQPRDEAGEPLIAIGEAVHASVAERYTGKKPVRVIDGENIGNPRPYRASNIAPLFGDDGAQMPGVTIAGMD